MKVSTFIFSVFLCFLLIAPQATLLSEEEDISYVYGEVVSISDKRIIVEEAFYDETTGEETVERIELDIAPDIEIENITSVSEIKAGDLVEITYIEKEGKKKADYIYYVTE